MDDDVIQQLYKLYGCYGIKSIEGFSVFIDEWIKNGGVEDALTNMVMVINTDTRSFHMWTEDIFSGP
jgi:hypothetical protein